MGCKNKDGDGFVAKIAKLYEILKEESYTKILSVSTDLSSFLSIRDEVSELRVKTTAEADKSKKEADRAKLEADRAEAEANKTEIEIEAYRFTYFEGTSARADILPNKTSLIFQSANNFLEFQFLIPDELNATYYSQTLGLFGKSDTSESIGFISKTDFRIRDINGDWIIWTVALNLSEINKLKLFWNSETEIELFINDLTLGVKTVNVAIELNTIADGYSDKFSKFILGQIDYNTDTLSGTIENIFDSNLVKTNIFLRKIENDKIENVLNEKLTLDGSNINLYPFKEKLDLTREGLVNIFNGVDSTVELLKLYTLSSVGDFVSFTAFFPNRDDYHKTLYFLCRTNSVEYAGFNKHQFWVTDSNNNKLKWDVAFHKHTDKIVIKKSVNGYSLKIGEADYGEVETDYLFSFDRISRATDASLVSLFNLEIYTSEDKIKITNIKDISKATLNVETKRQKKIYEKGLLVKSNNENSIDISTLKVTYRMAHTELIDKRSNVCRILRIYKSHIYEDNMYIEHPITNYGEIETAIKQQKDGEAKSDFMGGVAHGDEEFVTLDYYVDGQKITDISSVNTKAEKVEIFQHSNIYEVDIDEKNILANLYKKWEYTANGLIFKQTVEWLQDVSIIDAYLTMFPIYREQEGGVTTVGRRSPMFLTEDISEAGNNNVYSTSNLAETFGNRGVSAKIHIVNGFTNSKRLFNFSPSASYAKLYFNYGKNIEASMGDIWEIETDIAIDIKP